MSYEHLADIFSKAYLDAGSVAEALEIVDLYRVRTRGAALTEIVLAVAARLLAVPIGRMRARDRHIDVCRARWIAAWVLRGHGLKPGQIGKAMGLDRSTILHGFKRVQETPELMAAAAMVFSRVAVQDAGPSRVRLHWSESPRKAASSGERPAFVQETSDG